MEGLALHPELREAEGLGRVDGEAAPGALHELRFPHGICSRRQAPRLDDVRIVPFAFSGALRALASVVSVAIPLFIGPSPRTSISTDGKRTLPLALQRKCHKMDFFTGLLRNGHTLPSTVNRDFMYATDGLRGLPRHGRGFPVPCGFRAVLQALRITSFPAGGPPGA